MGTDTGQKPAVPRAAYRRREFLDAFGISGETFDRWVARGVVNVVKVGGALFVSADEVERLTRDGAEYPRPA